MLKDYIIVVMWGRGEMGRAEVKIPEAMELDNEKKLRNYREIRIIKTHTCMDMFFPCFKTVLDSER